MIQTAYVFTNDSLFRRCNEVSVSRELVRPTLEILSHGCLSTISLCSRLPSVLCVFISRVTFFFPSICAVLHLIPSRLSSTPCVLWFIFFYTTLPYLSPFLFFLSRLFLLYLGAVVLFVSLFSANSLC